MEPLPKRRRIFPPIGRDFRDELAYYEDTSEPDHVVEEEDLEEETVYDPDADLQQRRAQLDYKLKSTFEAIFEKYGKDFDGIGDEIDLATGDIVVNNGHLLDMENERDAGDANPAREVLTDFRQDPETPSSSMEETDFLDQGEEEDEEEDDGEDMLEDDMILRGFAKANRFIQPPPELGMSNDPYLLRNDREQETFQPRKPQGNTLPVVSKIMSQFGPQLGPQIVEYISQQQGPDNSHVEPAWRAPALPSSAPVKRHKMEPPSFELEVEHSPSPEAHTSIWAPPRFRGPRRADGADSGAIFRGESAAPKNSEVQYPDTFRRWSTSGLDQPNMLTSLGQKKKRRPFTEEDDQILLDWVKKSRKRGLALWSDRMWKELEAKHSNHTFKSWKKHYRSKFTYLWSEDSTQAEGSENAISETSIGDMVYEPKPTTVEVRPYDPAHLQACVRPTRIRKPAQTDSRIISWSEAVDAIESLDPDLHAGILEDSRASGHNTKADNPISAAGRDLRLPQQPTGSNRQVDELQDKIEPSVMQTRQYIDLTDEAEHRVSGSMAVEVTPRQEEILIPGAPCPHTDCRTYPTVLYKLQRRDDEELSEMCLHLFRVHHTTPFPCGELGCRRKGEEGYFMQADLVTHVRTAHPTISALHRLRGRVESELLNRSIDTARFPEGIVPTNRPVSQHRESDFMSPRKNSVKGTIHSSRPLSSSFDPDRTLTPRGTAGLFGVSRSTPISSVSSPMVHQSSGIRVIKTSESEERSKSGAQVEFLNLNGNGKETLRENQHLKSVTSGSSQRLGSRQTPSSQPLPESGGAHSIPTLPASSDCSLRQPFIFGDPLSKHTSISAMRRPSSHELDPFPVSISNSQSPKRAAPSNHSPPPPQTANTSNPVVVMESLSRNTVDTSYEFSDDETGVEPSARPLPTAQNKFAQVQTTVNRAVITAPSRPATIQTATRSLVPNVRQNAQVRALPTPSKVPAVSSATKSRPKKPISQRAIISDDIDELSMATDDFILLSSQPRTNHRSLLPVAIKNEARSNSPQLRTVESTRKRKLITFQETDDEDELGDPFTTSCLRAHVKKEVDENATPFTDRTTKRNVKTRLVHRTSPHNKDSRKANGTSTPLLDLTPSRNADATGEVFDSDAPSSSPAYQQTSQNFAGTHTQGQDGAAEIIPPPVDLLTPIRKKRWTEDPLKAEQVTIVIKTPGGSLRRCGEDDFACGRSFCFRCGSSGV